MIISKPQNNRLPWIDTLRGLAMVFVIFGHQCQSLTEYFVFTSPIKIPLFFAITGFVFNDKDGDLSAFFKNMFLKIIIPWIFLSLLPFRILSSILGISSKSVGIQIMNFFSGALLWYMPCCIIAEAIHFFIRKYLSKYIYVVCILFTITGLILAHFKIGNFARINTAFVAQSYIAIGFFIKEVIMNLIRNKRLKISFFFFIIYIFFGFLTLKYYPGECLDVHMNRYYNLFICGVMIITGLIISFIFLEFIYQKTHFSKGIFAYIGQNTLVYYMLNGIVLQIFRKFLTFFNISFKNNMFYWLILTAVACVGCGLISYILNRFFPFLVGKRRKLA